VMQTYSCCRPSLYHVLIPVRIDGGIDSFAFFCIPRDPLFTPDFRFQVE